MNSTIKAKYLSLIMGGCFLLFAIHSSAQQKDSVETMRQFLHICNAYKQQPLYLSLEYTTNTNFITSVEDTTSAQAEFYLTSKSAYIRFGELEQLVNDSMALLISGQMQRMFLYRNATPIIAQMKAMMGMQMPDSSIKNLCSKYKVDVNNLTAEAKSIILQSRNVLYNTFLPKETIELQYNSTTKLPLKVITTQRNVIPITAADYNNLINQKEFADKIYKTEENYFLVREKTTSYAYKEISHETIIKIPVSFEERIATSNTGKYIPVKEYENYVLTEE